MRGAIQFLEPALKLHRAEHGNEHLDVANDAASLALCALELGEVGRARELWVRFVEVLEAVYGPEDPDVLDARSLLVILSEPEDADARRAEIRKMVARAETAYGKGHPATAGMYQALASAISDLGDLDQARSLLERAMKIHRETFGQAHYTVAADLIALFELQMVTGDIPGALAFLDQAIDVLGSLDPEDSVGAAHAAKVSEAISNVARHGEEADVQEVLDRFASRLKWEHPVTRAALVAMEGAVDRAGAQLLAEGRPDEARRRYEHGLRLASRTEDPLDDARFRIRIAVAAAGLGDQPATEAALTAALADFGGAGRQNPLADALQEVSGLPGTIDPPPTLVTVLEELVAGVEMEQFQGSLSAGVPEGWMVKESITLLAPDGQANVIASSEPLDPSIDTERYADLQGELLAKEFPKYEELSHEAPHRFGDRETRIRRFRWSPPEGSPVTQIQMYHASSGRGYTATATTPTERFATVEPLLRRILDTLAIQG